jgi:hypothetical protein
MPQADPTVLADAVAASDDSLIRSEAGDFAVTEAEGVAYLALIGNLKTLGVRSPMAEILDKAVSLPNFRTA